MSDENKLGGEELNCEVEEDPSLAIGMEQVKLDDGEFSLDKLTQHFIKCSSTPGLSLSSYIAGYREVYKFLQLLGTVFGWVGSDVWAKIVVLQKYLDGEEKDKYVNIKVMIDHEVEINLIKTKKKDDPSGTRTLLRLHRALEYIILFLHKLEEIKDDDLCSVINIQAYEVTLMKYHPWVVQKAAKLAMKLLPTKKGLILKVHPEGSPEGIQKTIEDFPKAVTAMRAAFDSLQMFYKEKDLLDIP